MHLEILKIGDNEGRYLCQDQGRATKYFLKIKFNENGI